MKNFLIYLFLFTFSATVFSQEINQCAFSKQSRFARINEYNLLQYPGDPTIDVTYYLLDITVSHTTNRISGRVRVDGKSLEDNLTNFFLDLQDNLNLDSVVYKGKQVNTTHSLDKINITLSDTLNTNDSFSVDVYYHGIPGSSGFGSFEFSSHSGNPLIWTLSEPYGASDWFPVKDTPADKVDSSDVWITVDSDLIGVSNGTLVETIDNGNGTKTYKWKNHYPIAQYLISLAITNYSLYEKQFYYNDGKDSMVVDHYIFPENLTSGAMNQLDKTTNMLSVFSEKFGLYPFIKEKYGHAQFGWGGGMEHQTITSIVSFGRDLISHELAHQWFGDMITCKDWHHIWLNEGFATYLEAVYLEATSGWSAYKNKIAGEMSSAYNAYGSIWVQNINSVGEIFDYWRTYAKGAVVLHMLRGIVGSDKFYQIMYEYANDPELKYGVAVTEDFQAVAERVSGMDLDYFFEEWIYGELYPIYSVEWGYSNIGDGKYQVDFIINQVKRGTPRFFTMPIEIKIATSLGDTTFTVFNNGIEQETFSVIINGQPSKFELDPNNWILKELRSVNLTEVEGEEIIPAEFSLEQNYPNPFNPTTIIEYNLPKSAQVELTIYDVLGNKVKTLEKGFKTKGRHTVEFDAKDLSSGIYIYRIKSGEYTQARKMTLLK